MSHVDPSSGRPTLISGFWEQTTTSGWDASPSPGYPTALHSPVLIFTVVRREALSTRTARSAVERTNHEVTAPPTMV